MQDQNQQEYSDKYTEQFQTHYLGWKEYSVLIQSILDKQNGEIKLVKKFKHLDDYQAEKQLYEKLIKDFFGQEESLERNILLPTEYNDHQRMIYFQHTSCSLQQLLDEIDFNISADQAVQVFTILLESILTMKEKGYCYSNLKPESIYLVRSREAENHYQLKLIEIELLLNLQYSSYTPAFFNSPMREYTSSDGVVIFKNIEEKFQNMLFSVIRIFQFILYGVRNNKDFLVHNNLGQQSQLAKFHQIQQQINQQHTVKNKNHQINQILEFIAQKGLNETYNFDELQVFLKNLKQDSLDKQKCFIDDQNIVYSTEQKQNSKIKNIRSDPLAAFIRLNIFTPQLGSYSGFKQDIQFDIISEIQQKLVQSRDFNNESIIIIGKSGSGKTLLLLKLIQQLQANQPIYNIVHITDLKQAKTELFNLISKQLQCQVKKSSLLLLLDGYEQFNLKKLKISKLLTKKYKAVKIIVTTCPDNLTDLEINNAFGKNDKIYICPLNIDQKKDYISKVLQFFQDNKDCAQNYKFLDKNVDYVEMLSQNSSLNKHSNLPLMLSLIILVMPELKLEILKDANHVFSRYEIYQIFVYSYVNKKIQNLVTEKNYKKILSKKYGQQNFDEKLHQAIKIFNQHCSWQMLQEQKLELSQNDLTNVLNDIQQNPNIELSDILDLIVEASPAINIILFSYIHKSLQEFYIAQSIIEETVNAKQNLIEENSTLLGKAFLRFNIVISSLVSEHVIEMPLESQYLLFFQTWYSSILLTRKIKNGQMNDYLQIKRLEKIGSNCINLLLAFANRDLKNIDFSNCAIPYSYFYKSDLSRCNFSQANMDHSFIRDTIFNNSQFIETSMRDIKYEQFPDFIGHTKAVNSIVFSPDGKHLASCSFDKTVKLWNIESQREVITLKGHSNEVNGISFSPDGKYMASGSEDNTIKIWNIQNKKIILTLRELKNKVMSVAFSPDGRYLASGNYDGTVKLWTNEFQAVLKTFKSHSCVYSVAFSPNGKYLASSHWNNEIVLWSIGQKGVTTLYGHRDHVYSVAFSPDSKYLASGSNDDTVKLWNIKFQKVVATLQRFSGQVYSVQFSPDGKYLATGNGDKTVKLWNVESQKKVNTLQGYRCGVQSVAFSPDGKFLASSGWDRKIKLWSIESQNEVNTLQGHRCSVYSVEFSPDSKYLTSGSEDNTVKLWSIEFQKEITTLEREGDRGEVSTAAVSPDENYFAYVSDDNMVRVLSL